MAEDGDREQNKKDDKPEGEQKDKAKDKSDDKPMPRWPWFVAGVIVVGFIIVVLAIIFVPGDTVYTDDAYVTAHYATIAPRIAGQINAVTVDDNQPVRAGQLLVTIDDRDIRTTLANDAAMLSRDQAQAADYAAQIARLPSQIAQSQASLASSEAQLTFARADEARYRNLARTGAGTVQQRQQADMSLRQAEASVAGGQAMLDSTQHQLPILQAQYDAALGTVRSDQAQLAQAQLNLSYTRILAPVDGMVGEKNVQVGDYVSPGAAVMAVVPLDALYIVANYRELSLRHVLPGQRVRIHVDAYDLKLDGIVDSVPPASGAAFAPIQPNNATGNFTKIVQRLPVKILVAPGQPEARLLRIGLSVETRIETGLADVKGEQRNSPMRITTR